MLRSLKELIGYKIGAVDGELGKIKDLYFDDVDWAVRYFMVDTGSWLPGRKVLISPASAGIPDWAEKIVPVDLTKKQVEESPSIHEDLPVSLQHEKGLAGYYGWPSYWGPLGSGLGGPIAPEQIPVEMKEQTEEGKNSHLRSVHEVTGYAIEAVDGRIGHVDDFIADADTWKISFMVVDTRNWLPGKKVMITPPAIEKVDWSLQALKLRFTKDEVESSPEFGPSAPVNSRVVLIREDYYGRPRLRL